MISSRLLILFTVATTSRR